MEDAPVYLQHMIQELKQRNRREATPFAPLVSRRMVMEEEKEAEKI